jgi:protein gp37
MAYPTDIEWTDATWNPIGGCSIASPGCGPCYAQKLAGTRLKHHPLYEDTTSIVKRKPVFNGKLTAAPDGADVWTWPLSWRGAANPKLGHGMPSLIFVGDMSDVYHEDRAIAVQNRIVGTLAISRHKHIGQLLTKRPHVMAEHIISLHPEDPWGTFGDLRKCLWLGTSAERQREFDGRWPHLRRLAALGFTVFISYEPALGPLTLPADFLALGNRAWVIAGGCSGSEAWPSHPDWFRALRDQCLPAGVPFLFKQWGEWIEVDGPRCRSICIDRNGTELWLTPDGKSLPLSKPTTRHTAWTTSLMQRVGKQAAGRLLDSVEYNSFPAVERARAAA